MRQFLQSKALRVGGIVVTTSLPFVYSQVKLLEYENVGMEKWIENRVERLEQELDLYVQENRNLVKHQLFHKEDTQTLQQLEQKREAHFQFVKNDFFQLRLFFFLTNNYQLLFSNEKITQSSLKILRTSLQQKEEKLQSNALQILNHCAGIESLSNLFCKNAFLGAGFTTLTQSDKRDLREKAAQFIEQISQFNSNHTYLLNWLEIYKTMAESRDAMNQRVVANIITKFYNNQTMNSMSSEFIPFTQHLRFIFETTTDKEAKRDASIGIMFAQAKTKEAKQHLQQEEPVRMVQFLQNQFLHYLLPCYVYMGTRVALIPTLIRKYQLQPFKFSPTKRFIALPSLLFSTASALSMFWLEKTIRSNDLEDKMKNIPSNFAMQQRIHQWAWYVLTMAAIPTFGVNFVALPLMYQYYYHYNAHVSHIQNYSGSYHVKIV